VKSSTLIAVEWIWSHKGLYWRPSVLIDGLNKDPSAPKLTIAEAISIFKYLEEKGLIIPIVESGSRAYLLHEAKEQEWNAFICDRIQNPA